VTARLPAAVGGEEAYAPLWGSGILLELDYVLARLDAKRGRDDSEQRRRHLFDQMKRAFPGAEINAPRDREYDYGLGDPDDGHVAHAVLIGKADAVVTDDSRAGFKTSPVLIDAGVDIVYPHEFAANTVAAHPDAGVRALVAMSHRMRMPSLSPREVLDDLRVHYDMDGVAGILSPRLTGRE
jgi:hypothetical protein